MHADLELMELLNETSFEYDSSFEEGKTLESNNMKEVALSVGKDARGNKISGYLWQLMEGKRQVEEYVKLVQEAKQEASKPIVLATHSWHSHYSIEKGWLEEKQAKENLKKIKEMLVALKKKNEFKKISQVIH